MSTNFNEVLASLKPDDSIQGLVLSHGLLVQRTGDVIDHFLDLTDIVDQGKDVCCELVPLAADWGVFLRGEVTLAATCDVRSIIDHRGSGDRWFDHVTYGKHCVKTLDALMTAPRKGNYELWCRNFTIVGLWYRASRERSFPITVAYFKRQAQKHRVPCFRLEDCKNYTIADVKSLFTI